MKLEKLFNSMGFASRFGKLETLLKNICERLDKLEGKVEALSNNEDGEDNA